MKKLIVTLCLITVFTSCKNDSKKEVSAEENQQEIGVREISGNFIYYDDAAVLQTNSELFGVIQNDKYDELIKKSMPLKGQATDEVAVTLKAKVSKKPEGEEGWDNRVEIIDIIKVSKVNPEDSDIIKLGLEK